MQSIELGEVEIKEDVQSGQLTELNIGLKKAGLRLMDDKKSILSKK